MLCLQTDFPDQTTSFKVKLWQKSWEKFPLWKDCEEEDTKAGFVLTPQD